MIDRIVRLATVVFALALASCGSCGTRGGTTLRFATTTSVKDSGLLAVLLPALEKKTGYKVDVSPTTCVSSYITSHYAYYGVRSDGATMYRAASGNIYARESNHWDITYYTCGC